MSSSSNHNHNNNNEDILPNAETTRPPDTVVDKTHDHDLSSLDYSQPPPPVFVSSSSVSSSSTTTEAAAAAAALLDQRIAEKQQLHQQYQQRQPQDTVAVELSQLERDVLAKQQQQKQQQQQQQQQPLIPSNDRSLDDNRRWQDDSLAAAAAASQAELSQVERDVLAKRQARLAAAAAAATATAFQPGVTAVSPVTVESTLAPPATELTRIESDVLAKQQQQYQATTVEPGSSTNNMPSGPPLSQVERDVLAKRQARGGVVVGAAGAPAPSPVAVMMMAAPAATELTRLESDVLAKQTARNEKGVTAVEEEEEEENASQEFRLRQVEDSFTSKRQSRGGSSTTPALVPGVQAVSHNEATTTTSTTTTPLEQLSALERDVRAKQLAQSVVPVVGAVRTPNVVGSLNDDLSQLERDVMAKRQAHHPGNFSLSGEGAAVPPGVQRVLSSVIMTKYDTPPPTELSHLDRDIRSKQRGRKQATPDLANQALDPTIAEELSQVERDVLAKRQARLAAPSAFNAVDSIPAKFAVPRASVPGVEAVLPADGARSSDLQRLENAVASKIQRESETSTTTVPGAQTVASRANGNDDSVSAGIGTPGSLRGLEDAVAAKVRSEHPEAAVAGTAMAQLSSLERAVSAKIRGEESTGGGRSSLNSLEYAVAAKVHGNMSINNRQVPGSAAFRLERLEDAILAKVGTSAGSSARETNDHVAGSLEMPPPGNKSRAGTACVRSLNQMEMDVMAKASAATRSNPSDWDAKPQSSGAPPQLSQLERDVRAKIRGEDSDLDRKMPAQNHASWPGQNQIEQLEMDLRSKVSATPDNMARLPLMAVDAGYNEAMASNVARMPSSEALQHADYTSTQAEDHRKNGVVNPYDQGTPAGLVTTADTPMLQQPDLEYSALYSTAAGEGMQDSLAVAMPVEEEDEDPFLPSAVEYDPDSKPMMKDDGRRRRFWLYGSLAIFIIIAAIIGGSVGGSLAKKNDHANLPAQTLPPSSPREGLGIQSLVSDVVGGQMLIDPSSPYSKALSWITFDDPQQLTPDAPNFVQRYIAAYLYFATTTDGPWTSCGPPGNTADMSPNNEHCTWQYLTQVNPPAYNTPTAIRWLTNYSECDWAGLDCDSHGQVIQIDLPGSNFTGTFPEGMQYFTFLQGVNIAGNSLKGTLPDEFFQKPYFNSLHFEYNQLTGSIPNSVWNVNKLQSLSFGNNSLTGSISSAVGSLYDVKALRAYNNRMTGTLPEELGNLDSVSIFYLYNNDFGGTIPSSTTKWNSIQQIYLTANKITGSVPSWIGQFNQTLQLLKLGQNQFKGTIPSVVFELTQMSALDLSDNRLSGTLSPSIAQLGRMLTTLQLSGNLFTGTLPESLGNLTNVYEVDLQDNNFVGTMPELVCSLESTGPGSVLFGVLNQLGADCAPNASGYIQLECPSSCCTTCCDPAGGNCVSRGRGN